MFSVTHDLLNTCDIMMTHMDATDNSCLLSPFKWDVCCSFSEEMQCCRALSEGLCRLGLGGTSVEEPLLLL